MNADERGFVWQRLRSAFSGICVNPACICGGTIESSSEIAIPPSFTAEHVENAEASGNPVRIETVLKTLAPSALLRGDKTLGLLDTLPR
ncbi:MAG: hypothetical protein U9Q37_09370 [Euryarchaeota archaeon]|nr:hypothetical protein [Euryarchaeota archaeon]